MSDINITMRLFGAFRKHGETVTFTMPRGCTAESVKARLAEVLNQSDAGLIGESALANDNEIISGDTVLLRDCQLAILPPVCGG